ncbi:hypothetical protein D9758_015222 [Tetrapyrgos nigripes]|uniref:Uncharacterized protein n=1 Tax=Tetrapyrgos nigripes TaxID=182062 RepID=A0A8H5CLJ5_9AGAR|nr:hypothetical protein D9758_015222 [Tetrapyrgos nigripes]
MIAVVRRFVHFAPSLLGALLPPPTIQTTTNLCSQPQQMSLRHSSSFPLVLYYPLPSKSNENPVLLAKKGRLGGGSDVSAQREFRGTWLRGKVTVKGIRGTGERWKTQWREIGRGRISAQMGRRVPVGSHPQPQLRARCILNDSIPSLEIHQKATGMSEPAIASICSRTTLHFPLRHHLPSPSSTMTTLSIRFYVPSSRSSGDDKSSRSTHHLKPNQGSTSLVMEELVWMRSFWVGVENVVSEEKMNRVQGTEGDRKETGTSLGSGQ